LVTHPLAHIELMGDDVTEAPGEAASRTTSRTTPTVGPLAKAPTAATGAEVVEASGMSTVSVMGIVDAATAKTMHVRLNASATAAPKPRCDKQATRMAMGVDTRKG